MNTVAVVGCDGTLGMRLTAALDAVGVRLRHPGDRMGAESLDLANADVVVDVSGPRARPDMSWAEYHREHVGTSVTVARAMRPGAHLIHVSSASVYGARDERVNAASPEAPGLFPVPSYAWAKFSGEMSARAICRERGVGVTVLRPPVVYGPGLTGSFDTLFRLAERGVVLDLRPAAMPQHLAHIDLLVAAVRRLAELGPRPQAVLNVADPFVVRNGEVLDALRARRASGVTVPVPLGAAQALLARWPGFPSLDAPMKLAALGVFALGVTFDADETFDALSLDPAPFARALTWDPYLASR